MAEETKEKTAQTAPTAQAVQNSNNLTTNNNIAPAPSKGKRGKKKKCLTMYSKVRTLSIKCYDEQLPNGVDDLIQRIKEADFNKMHVIAIKHDRDLVGDDFWSPAVDKPHYHIIMRMLGANANIRVGTFLNKIGVEYRPGLDDALVREHGVETCRHFDNMTAYLLHMTPESIEDGKEPYYIQEMVSNLTPEEIQQVLDGYIRVGHGGHKVDFETMEDIDKQAFQLGYDLKDFEPWYNALDFATRTNAKMRVVKESYQRGIQTRANDPNNRALVRTCIFIQSEHNVGKTYAAMQACQKMGLPYLVIGGAGTGKYDKLKPSHQAIIVDDDTMPNLLNMSDNYITQAYKRGSNNPWWCGSVLIVTSNLTFDEWLEECGFTLKEWDEKKQTWVTSRHVLALRSRFFICKVNEEFNGLECLSPSKRGSIEAQRSRLETYIKLRDYIDESLCEYKVLQKQNDEVMSYDALNNNLNPFSAFVTESQIKLKLQGGQA